jgi:aspartate-semialdehyde dehydrogenase
VRKGETIDNGLVLFVACDNLRKGAALNAIQTAELLLERYAVPA